MKQIVFIILTLFCIKISSAQVADGYFINKSGDTIRGKIEIPFKKEAFIVGSSSTGMGTSPAIVPDPLKNDSLKESKQINYSKLTFDFKFQEETGKYNKIDRLKVKGFGFFYEGHQYDYTTWDVTVNKQLYLMPVTGDVVPDGIYFILRSTNNYFPIYSLFQDVELLKQTWDTRPGTPSVKKELYRNAIKRDIIIKHPTKGFIYISSQYPLMMKYSEILKYLELEDDFTKTISKKDIVWDIIKKYNSWKSQH